jgi:NAD-dependent SIR2 family protein deacetylase
MKRREHDQPQHDTDTSDSDSDEEPCLKRRKIQLPLRTVQDVQYFSKYYQALEDVTWMTSHLDSNFIIWSNAPNLLAPRYNQSNNYVVEESIIPAIIDGSCTVENALKTAHDAIHSNTYSHVLIIAGAGCSVDCTDERGQSLPDYRTSGAIWKKQVASVNKTMEELDDPILFSTDPALVWGMFAYKMRLFLNSKPHEGYQKLKNVQQDCFIMTSNVDGLFHKSGHTRVYECHGSLRRMQCTDPSCKQQVWEITSEEITSLLEQLDDEQVRLKNEQNVKYPKCPTCAAIARPNVSMHGDTNLTYNDAVNELQKSQLQAWINQVWKQKKKLLVIEIGCGVSLHSLRVESNCLVKRDPKNTKLVRINNMDPSCVTDELISVQSNALHALLHLF